MNAALQTLGEMLKDPNFTGHLGSGLYIITLLLVGWSLFRGHSSHAINLWELFTTTSRSGKAYTDPRKLFEAIAFVVMTITFFFLTVTNRMTEWYALIYAGSWVAARTLRDKAKIQQSQIQDPAKEA